MYVPLAQFVDDRRPAPPVDRRRRAAAERCAGTPRPERRRRNLNGQQGSRPDVSALADQVNAALTQERVVAMLAGSFGALALLLAGLGLYGVTSYTVSRRRTEIGIRMALGAAPTGVIRLVLTRVALLVAVGIAIGAAASAWASRFVATLLYGLEASDPATLLTASVTLAMVGALAGFLPARRAARIDPAGC